MMLSHDSSLAPRLVVHSLAILVAERHRALLTPVFPPEPAHCTDHARRLARRRSSGSQVRGDRCRVGGYALKAAVASGISYAGSNGIIRCTHRLVSKKGEVLLVEHRCPNIHSRLLLPALLSSPLVGDRLTGASLGTSTTHFFLVIILTKQCGWFGIIGTLFRVNIGHK